MSFDDRASAGRRLAALLGHHRVDADVVLGVPPGGLPVAGPVADELDAVLGVVAATEMTAPGDDVPIGAAAADGSVCLHDDAIAHLDVGEASLRRARERAAAAAARTVERYRDGRDPPTLAGAAVVVVDDGVAADARMRACVERVRNAGAAALFVAVPVGSPASLSNLAAVCDDVYAVESPPHFRTVRQFYRDFGPVTDATAFEQLDRDVEAGRSSE